MSSYSYYWRHAFPLLVGWLSVGFPLTSFSLEINWIRPILWIKSKINENHLNSKISEICYWQQKGSKIEISCRPEKTLAHISVRGKLIGSRARAKRIVYHLFCRIVNGEHWHCVTEVHSRWIEFRRNQIDSIEKRSDGHTLCLIIYDNCTASRQWIFLRK